MKYLLYLVGAVLLMTSCQQGGTRLSDYQLVDLSYPLSEETLYWPTAQPFEIITESEGITEGGYYYSSHFFKASEHGGTHMDAPVHFAEGKATVDVIPLTQLRGPAFRIDLQAKAKENPDYQITREDLLDWEKRNGRIPPDAVILLQTGYGSYWPQAQKYLGTTERGQEAVAKLHFPGLHPSAAQWLVDHRAPAMVGIDTASIDYGQSKDFLTHQILSRAQIPILENVAHLDLIPSQGFEVIALPMKIAGGSGAPTRILALLPPKPSP